MESSALVLLSLIPLVVVSLSEQKFSILKGHNSGGVDLMSLSRCEETGFVARDSVDYFLANIVDLWLFLGEFCQLGFSPKWFNFRR